MLRPAEGSRSRHLLSFAAFPAGVAIIVAALSSLGSSTSDQAPPPAVGPVGGGQQHFPLAIGPDPIAFGVLSPGASAQTSLSVRSTQAAPLTLSRVETSCSCVGLAPVPTQIGPGESKTLDVTFDSSSEPEFEGVLSVEITGYLSDGRIGFRTLAKLNIRPDGADRDD